MRFHDVASPPPPIPIKPWEDKLGEKRVRGVQTEAQLKLARVDDAEKFLPVCSIRELAELLIKLEWSGSASLHYPGCPICGGAQPYIDGTDAQVRHQRRECRLVGHAEACQLRTILQLAVAAAK